MRSVGSGAADVNRPSFQGRGPKSYARSDERLRELICERLLDDPLVDASDLDAARGALVHNRLRVQCSEGP